MSKNRIVVVGGVATGPKAAARARRCDPNADITIIERGDLLSYAGCGMPYYIQGQIETADELMSTASGAVRDAAFFKNVKGINVLDRALAESIDRKRKVVEVVGLETGEKIEVPYDKLVLATGADAIQPPFNGSDLKGIYRLNHPYDAENIKNAASDKANRKAVIIGAGLIGLEMAEALTELGLTVRIIELMDTILPTFLDFEIASYVEANLKARGVDIMTKTRVTGFEGDHSGKVTTVLTDQGSVDADLVLVAAGVRPNVKLARDAGLEIGTTGAIKVNERLQTSDPDIYAGGDCVENINRITGRPCYAPLGSTANKHGRIIGTNVTGGNAEFEGVLGTAVFKVFETNVGRVGLSEKECAAMGIKAVVGLTPGPDRAHYYPTARPIILKLVADAETGRLLGMQAAGPGDVVKRVDVAATAITFGADVHDISGLDLGYAPPYSSAVDPISHAANVIDNKMQSLARSVSPAEVKKMMDAGEDFVLLDVRTPVEVETAELNDKRVMYVPLGKLRSKIQELPRNKQIIIFCKTSLRAYEAQRILDGEGFENVWFMDGGLLAWPYSQE